MLRCAVPCCTETAGLSAPARTADKLRRPCCCRGDIITSPNEPLFMLMHVSELPVAWAGAAAARVGSAAAGAPSCAAPAMLCPPSPPLRSQANLDRNSLMAQANMQFLNASAARDDVMWCVHASPAAAEQLLAQPPVAAAASPATLRTPGKRGSCGPVLCCPQGLPEEPGRVPRHAHRLPPPRRHQQQRQASLWKGARSPRRGPGEQGRTGGASGEPCERRRSRTQQHGSAERRGEPTGAMHGRCWLTPPSL